MKRRFLILLLALDHLALTLFTLGNCKPYEMISSAAWGLEQDGKFFGFMRPVIDFLFSHLQRDHCQKCWQIEQRQIILFDIAQ